MAGLRFLLTLAGCILYVGEAFYFDFCDDGCKKNSTANTTENLILKDILTLLVLDSKPWSLWALQVVVGVLCFMHSVFILYALSVSNSISMVMRTDVEQVLVVFHIFRGCL